jgi:hypothetical protein
MNSIHHGALLVLTATVFVLDPIPLALAETPGEIPKPWTYEGSMKLQEQQSQGTQVPQQDAPQGAGRAASGGGAAPGAAAADAARRRWLSAPPLPPEKNPLLGKWTRPASSRPNPNDPFGQIQALAKGGLCEVLFGGGVFEFRPDALLGSDERTRPQELDRVEYRGDAKHVVVLPKTTVKLMEFDFEGPDRVNWKSQNCVLVRVAAAAGESQKVAPAASAATSASQASAQGVLTLSASALSPHDTVSARKFWILKGDPQVALIKAGVTSTPYGTVLQNWMRACEKKQPLCFTGMQALQPISVGIVAADAGGRARTPPMPSGRYWVLCDANVDSKHVMWHQPVDVKGPDASITLDQGNVMSVN